MDPSFLSICLNISSRAESTDQTNETLDTRVKNIYTISMLCKNNSDAYLTYLGRHPLVPPEKENVNRAQH